ncbi:MAG: NUDIX domain-containing protein [Bacteroidales bacterium]|jgi:ADP-ribose pyrophosphatase YjhB (NUDIX family)|nr:NUDIX domain-containing protein [Bacteroidales bacterium]
MYKVFHENRCLVLFQTIFDNIDPITIKQGVEWNHILHRINQWLEEDNGTKDHIINTFSIDPMELFHAVFEVKDAAGGLLFHDNSLVIIERNGIPDLPKGHLEKGENEIVAALREVEEETGLHGIILRNKAAESLHCYQLEKRWILKRTAWFGMSLNGDFEPKPQKEEGITAVSLIKKPQLDEFLSNTYRSISETLGTYIKAEIKG